VSSDTTTHLLAGCQQPQPNSDTSPPPAGDHTRTCGNSVAIGTGGAQNGVRSAASLAAELADKVALPQPPRCYLL